MQDGDDYLEDVGAGAGRGVELEKSRRYEDPWQSVSFAKVIMLFRSTDDLYLLIVHKSA